MNDAMPTTQCFHVGGTSPFVKIADSSERKNCFSFKKTINFRSKNTSHVAYQCELI
jgi:hypothetical protein